LHLATSLVVWRRVVKYVGISLRELMQLQMEQLFFDILFVMVAEAQKIISSVLIVNL
jgi:hypothetical protein